MKTRWPDIDSLDERSIPEVQARLRRGAESWIVQGYMRLGARLRSVGFDASMADAYPADAICVAHRDDLNRYGDPLYDCYVVGVRADRPALRVARIEVVQNGLDLASPRSRYIPSWPQPGLVPRAAARGTRVECVAYMGRCGATPPWYHDGRLAAGLASLGVAFEIRERQWNDYSAVDVVVAHRDEAAVMLRQKPASKLCNAWHAGAPAVLAPEPAYRELRRSPLDFIEAGGIEDVVQGVRELRDDPARYRAMVENGWKRAADFSSEAIAARWIDLISREIVPGFDAWRRSRPAWPVRQAAHLRDMSAQKLVAMAFRRQQRRELGKNAQRARSRTRFPPE